METHESSGSAGAVDDQVGHVTDQVSGESEVEEHVEDVEDHLSDVDRMKVSVSDGGEGRDGPVHGRHVPDPYRLFQKVLVRRPDPRVLQVPVSSRQKVVKARRAVHSK